jgi:hypothetical protein
MEGVLPIAYYGRNDECNGRNKEIIWHHTPDMCSSVHKINYVVLLHLICKVYGCFYYNKCSNYQNKFRWHGLGVHNFDMQVMWREDERRDQ